MDELPLRVRKVRIVGNKRTRPYVVEDQLQVCYVLWSCPVLSDPAMFSGPLFVVLWAFGP